MTSRTGILLVLWAVLAASPALAASRAVLFLFDTSGSLSARDLEAARQVARETLARLDGDDKVGVVSFDDRAVVRAPLDGDGEAFRQALDGLAIGGRWTTLNDALYDAGRLLRDSQAARRAIVLFTDGHDENSALVFEDAERELTQSQVAVFPVGVGARIDERFMRRLAKLRDGEYHAATALADPPAAATAILARLDALPPSPTPTPAATPSPTPRRRGAAPGAASRASVPIEPTAERSEVLDYLKFGAMFLALALLLGVLFAPRILARRKPRQKPVPYSSWPTPPPAPAVEPAPALERAPPSEPEPPPAFPEAAGSEPSEPVAEPGRGMLATIPVAGAPPLRLEPRLHEPAESEGGAFDALSPTLVSRTDDPAIRAGIDGEYLDRTVMLALRPILIVRKGRNSGETFLLQDDGDTFLGRGQVNHVVLGDRAVSSRHARIQAEGQAFTLHDLDSTNGTFVNDRRLERGSSRPLQEGDLIRLGETELEFQLEARHG